MNRALQYSQKLQEKDDFHKMRYQAAIFDLDGVIVNTAIYHYQAWKKIAEKLGFVLTHEQNELLKGVSRMASMDIVERLSTKTLTQLQKVELAEEKNNHYVQLINQLTPQQILPGVLECFHFLKQRRTKIVLGSASKNALLVLHQLGIEPMFDAIIDGKQVTKAKPNPQVFLKGADACGIPPRECVVFEDSAAGIQAANSAGMYSVYLGKSNASVHADATANSLNEPKILKLF